MWLTFNQALDEVRLHVAVGGVRLVVPRPAFKQESLVEVGSLTRQDVLFGLRVRIVERPRDVLLMVSAFVKAQLSLDGLALLGVAFPPLPELV
jgi:hypothetical protein